MKLSVISFTKNGYFISRKVCELCDSQGIETKNYTFKDYGEQNENIHLLSDTLSNWCQKQVLQSDGLIFICASGIAVRAIAPFLKNKYVDPAVIVMDDSGKYVIPIVSGHIGGANQLARLLAEHLHSIPVITTATDNNSVFAVDEWVKQYDFYVSDYSLIKNISAELLDGHTIGLCCDFPIKGFIPDRMMEYKETVNSPLLGIAVSTSNNKNLFRQTLQIIPRIISIGIGCKKGVDYHIINERVREVLLNHDISIHAAAKIGTIDRKALEPGILTFCEKWKLPLHSYRAEQLMSLKGEFSQSEFVYQTTGVDCVSERSAVMPFAESGKNYELIVRKHGKDGVTVAVAKEKLEVSFENNERIICSGNWTGRL